MWNDMKVKPAKHPPVDKRGGCLNAIIMTLGVLAVLLATTFAVVL